ncbi:MAG: DUF4956 domain-containing protein [Longimicrobiales bacterium]|nr:DUF4956 domain-containing protein [Longimicrobiales bacterium]
MGIKNLLRRIVDGVTRVPRHPVRQLLAWYAVIGTLGALLSARIPMVRQAVLSTAQGGVADASEMFLTPSTLPVETASGDIQMAIVMLGTLLLSVPVSWGYMAAREVEGFDQSVVQTIVVLPVVVAAIMMIVQHSLPLAFALAGVSAAVRFRNTLKDVADATYVFLALGVGIASGVGALAAAAVMSAIFVFVAITLWRCDFGTCPSTVAFAARGDRAVPERVKAARVPDSARDGILSIDLSSEPRDTSVLERLLGHFAKKYEVERWDPGPEGGGILRYRVRLRKWAVPDAVVNELVASGGDEVEAAAFDLPHNRT